ncbi:MAG: histidinol-phosphatase [Synergistaceae bacterium]|nr:histidinol-phosphatase [Synergistaceae bacterium]
MILADFHMHTIFCDGKDTPEDMVLEAISRGMKKIGFSGHSYTSFDPHVCMTPENIAEYKAEINRLKGKYKSKIEILCGIEQDYYSDFPAEGYDFVIGSLHYVTCGGEYIAVDHTFKHFEDAVAKFNGDVYNLIENYFATVADVVNKTNADIIGHFDLISKFNDGNKYFDENHPRYVKATENALDKLLATGKPFEINTGAMSRGYKKVPYPSKRILEYIAAHNGSVILSSDSHRKETLMYNFQECEELANSLGLKIVTI